MSNSADAARTRLIGIASALGAVLIFSANDVTIKFLSSGYALHQITLMRGVVAVAILLGVLMPLYGGFWAQVRTTRLPLHMMRASLVVGANSSLFLAVSVMPLAEAMAIFFIAPLLTTAFSVIFLRERVGPRRWAAVVLGLIGVMVVLRPGTASFQPAALLAVLAACFYSAMNIMTRRLGSTESALTMSFYNQVMFLVVGCAMGLSVGDGHLAQSDGVIAFLLRAWVWPAWSDVPLILVLGFAAAVGGTLLSQAYRKTEAALIAPFEYAAILLAVFWGWAIFGEWPDAIAWVGIALIISAGLYTLWRETQLRRAERRAPPQ